MRTQYLTNAEDIEFPKLSSAKQMPGNSLEAKQIGRLGSLPHFHMGSNLDKESSNSATVKATKFAGPHKSHMCQYTTQCLLQ
jgi:hypothetical protein